MFSTTTINHLYALSLTQQPKAWRPLRLLNYYRICLACVFIVLFMLGPLPTMLGQHNPSLFYVFSLLYLVFACIYIYTLHAQKPDLNIQLLTQVITDIIALTILIYASGGLASGLGILLMIAVTCSSLIASGRQAVLIASIATLATLFQATYAGFYNDFHPNTYAHAGLLGVGFFVTALVSLALSRRIRESEALVAQHELDLANLEELNEHIIKSMRAGILVVDQNNKIRLLNAAARRFLKLNAKNTSGSALLMGVSAALFERLQTWRKNSHVTSTAFTAAAQAPEIIAHFTPLGATEKSGTLISLESASELAQKVQQEKLAALGRLTASIAHEIRNPLGAISHAAQLLAESGELSEADKRLTQIVHQQCNRVNTIVENILQLSRRDRSYPQTFTLKPWVTQFQSEFCKIERLAENNIETSIADPALEVSFDPSQLEQVLWNLCRNALQHGRHANGLIPKLLLRAGRIDETNQTFLEVVDDGPGITPDATAKLFEPFYTTAEKGTGLGLYITRELCACNNAQLHYFANEPNGACFRVIFSSEQPTTRL